MGGDFTKWSYENDMPSLKGKVIFVTGGTAGLGATTDERFAGKQPTHIYFTGRNSTTALSTIERSKAVSPETEVTFVQLDQSDLSSVAKALAERFHSERLDILVCNAGIMAVPMATSKDGYESQFTVNHLSHALIIKALLPKLLATAQTGADGPGGRYAQSKFANIVYAAELARRYPQITSVSVHPGVVETGLVKNQPFTHKVMIYLPNLFSLDSASNGILNTLWAAASDKSKIENGACYYPVGINAQNKLDSTAKDPKVAKKLWEFTDEVLEPF